MRLAVVYKDDQIFVEFPPEKFVELLEEYTKTRSISEAIKKMIDDLKKETLYK